MLVTNNVLNAVVHLEKVKYSTRCIKSKIIIEKIHFM